jgi:predicted HTH domain antitoxin
MQKMVVEVPDEFAAQFDPYQDRLDELLIMGLRQIKIHESLLFYSRGLVSFARAAELAGLPQAEMIQQARAFGIKPRWSEQMVQEELA